MKTIVALDVGTSGVKACLFQTEGDEFHLLSDRTEKFGLYSDHPGYAEQEPEEIWRSVCAAIHHILAAAVVSPSAVDCVSICSQAMCVVMTDKQGNALRRSLNSQDSRGGELLKRYFGHGIQVDGVNVWRVMNCLQRTAAASVSAKDPVYKFKWVQENEPEIYAQTYKWLDIKDYLLCRLTGRFVTTRDNAHSYLLYNSSKNDAQWNRYVCKLHEVDTDKLPEIVHSTEKIGTVTERAAAETGLAPGVCVIGGIIDSSGIQIGSGAVSVGQTQVYWGSSGWVSTVLDKLSYDLDIRGTALISPEEHRYYYYAPLESAGLSYSWLKNHVVSADGIAADEADEDDSTMYAHMGEALQQVPAGSDGLLFAPWVSGTRAPFEASDIGGMFVNLKISMGKKHLVRAVAEGICYHYRLLGEAETKKYGTSERWRFVGGGAKSPAIAQVLADVTGHIIEVPAHPEDAGALGAAIVGYSAISENAESIEAVAKRIPARQTFYPNPENREIYDRIFAVYKKLYAKNKDILAELTQAAQRKEGI